MFTIFKRVRKKLIGKGNLSRYLLYAIGEILLVVIGILIALQVNNWNEERNLALSERILLESVLESLEEDSVLFADVQSDIRQIDKIHRSIYGYLEEGASPDSITNLRYVRRSLLYNPVTLINHPDLANELISRDLKQATRMYFQHMNNVQYAIDNFNMHLEESIRPLLAELNVLNYGVQYRNDIDLFLADDLIRREAFINKLDEPYLQQMLFEAGVKQAASFILLTNLQDENTRMTQRIEQYLMAN